MQTWQRIWREGIAPQLPATGLEALARALEQDSPELLQTATVLPPPIQPMAQAPVEACCALAFAIWKGDQLDTVQALDEGFGRLCEEVGKQLGDPDAAGLFFRWFDDAPRPRMRTELLAEVNAELDRRRDSTRTPAA